MRHIVRAGSTLLYVKRHGDYVVLTLNIQDCVSDPDCSLSCCNRTAYLHPDEARDLAERLRGVADAIEEPQRRAAADPRQMRLNV